MPAMRPGDMFLSYDGNESAYHGEALSYEGTATVDEYSDRPGDYEVYKTRGLGSDDTGTDADRDYFDLGLRVENEQAMFERFRELVPDCDAAVWCVVTRPVT